MVRSERSESSTRQSSIRPDGWFRRSTGVSGPGGGHTRGWCRGRPRPPVPVSRAGGSRSWRPRYACCERSATVAREIKILDRRLDGEGGLRQHSGSPRSARSPLTVLGWWLALGQPRARTPRSCGSGGRHAGWPARSGGRAWPSPVQRRECQQGPDPARSPCRPRCPTQGPGHGFAHGLAAADPKGQHARSRWACASAASNTR